MLQLLVVVSPNWEAVDGTLCRYQRHSSKWEQIGSTIPVTLGKKGMTLAHLKKEGDETTPAGIFSLGPVFGDVTNQIYAKHMPFLEVTDDLECVDDPNSIHYNRFVTGSIERDWQSSEKMNEIGVYTLGVVIQHNLNPVKVGNGSAIFMHPWDGERGGTAGCTAMAKEHLQEIVLWLDMAKKPHLVQLPISEYRNKQSEWELPDLHEYLSRAP